VAGSSADMKKTAIFNFGGVPDEAVFVDDNAENVAAARSLGLESHLFTSAAELRAFLEGNGLLSDTGSHSRESPPPLAGEDLGGGYRAIATILSALFLCPPTLTLPRKGGGKI